jgi:multisubunit Na+/H+ antiporter MnhG subunit
MAGRDRSAPSRSPGAYAAGASLGLGVLQVVTAVGRTDPAAYVVVVLLLGAVLSTLAGVGLARGGDVLSRTVAAGVALGCLVVVGLLVTVGGPGATPAPFGPSSALALVLASSVLVLLGLRRRATRAEAYGHRR